MYKWGTWRIFAWITITKRKKSLKIILFENHIACSFLLQLNPSLSLSPSLNLNQDPLDRMNLFWPFWRFKNCGRYKAKKCFKQSETKCNHRNWMCFCVWYHKGKIYRQHFENPRELSRDESTRLKRSKHE